MAKAKIQDLFYEEHIVGAWPEAVAAVTVLAYRVSGLGGLTAYDHCIIDLDTPSGGTRTVSVDADSDVIREAIRQFDAAVAALGEAEPEAESNESGEGDLAMLCEERRQACEMALEYLESPDGYVRHEKQDVVDALREALYS